MTSADWKTRRLLTTVTLLVTFATLAPAAAASVDGEGEAAPRADSIEVEVGEGIPEGISPELLREQEAALRGSAVGREWLRTSEGRAHTAEVSRVLRRGTIGLRSAAAGGPGGGGNVDPGGGGGCDYDCYNAPDEPSSGEAGGADGYGYFGGCKQPWVVAKHRNYFGHDLWRYYEQLYWCWNGGEITYVYRTRWAWVSGHWLNGWSFQGHQSTNCYSEACYGHWIGSSWARYWTQGKFEVCNLKWIGCRAKHPMVGIDVNAWGGWGGWIN